MGLMEYIILTFFIFIIVVVLIFFLVGFQITQFSLEKKGGELDRALFLAKTVSASPLFTKESGILDDSKLASLGPNACQDMEKTFGRNWYFEITVIDSPEVACNQLNYPNCNSWSFCSRPGNSIAFDLPINIYRSVSGRTDIGILKAGVYVE